MHRWGMVIDLDKCSACQACVVACQAENNVPIIGPAESVKGRTIHWIELIPYFEGEFPHIRGRLLPRPCMHCDNPPCTKVCPVYATYRNPEGLVAQINHRCIGCRYCTTACPYTVKYFNWYPPEWPKEMQSSLNRDVSIRTKGVVEKCTFCSHRLDRARIKVKIEGRDLLPGDYVPACVQACPSGAMYFGDLNDVNSVVSMLSRERRAFRLMEELGTEPKVIYLSEGM